VIYKTHQENTVDPFMNYFILQVAALKIPIMKTIECLIMVFKHHREHLLQTMKMVVPLYLYLLNCTRNYFTSNAIVVTRLFCILSCMKTNYMT